MSNTRVAGRYTLLREVGRGANGPVWAAHDDVLGRPVALKRVGRPPSPTEAVDPAGAVRAEREARLAAQVTHPHVVAVYDLVTADDGLWLVMEQVEGPALSTLVRDRGPLGPDDAARLLAPIADALSTAHDLGIVHRDVKPSNILLGDDGHAKLTDFGIARGAEDATLTRTGLVTGSPAYLAPEVATGGSATRASDVWALGATLVHLLTGRPPYHRDDADNGPLAVVYRIVNDPAPRPGEAGRLLPVLEASMHRDPERRPSMAVLHDVLLGRGQLATDTVTMPLVPEQPAQAWSPTTPAPSTPPPSTPPPPTPPPPATVSPAPGAPARRPRRLAVLAGAGLAVLLVLGGALALTRGGTEEPGRDPGTAAAATTTTPPASATAPTAEELEDFARTYVATASEDPQAGFAMLTADYQAASPQYAEFWGAMRNPRIEAVTADVTAMTVSYTYSYVLPGRGRRTEDVTLRLVQEDSALLIAGTG